MSTPTTPDGRACEPANGEAPAPTMGCTVTERMSPLERALRKVNIQLAERATVELLTGDVALLRDAAEDRLRVRDAFDRACHQIAEMHAAAVGEVRGPIRGVVEDIADLRTRCLAAEQALQISHAAAEHALTWLPQPDRT